MQIGFIGLGNMGLPMACNLIDAGLDVVGFDVVEERAAALAEHGGDRAPGVVGTVDGSSVVVTMVRTPDQVRAVTAELFPAMEAGDVYVDMSTIGPAATDEIRADAEDRGIRMLDAPVSGGVVGAEDGTLTIMAGGPADLFEEVAPVFEVVGGDIYHVGDLGSGQTAKMCLQILIGAEIVSICESFRLADRADMDLEVLYDVLTDSLGTSGILEVKGDRILDRDYEPGADIDLQYKDMELVLDAARELTSPMPVTAAATQEFIHARARELGDRDQFAMFELYD